MTPTIFETSFKDPPHVYDQATLKARLDRWIDDHDGRGRAFLSTLDTNLVERRAFAIPLEEMLDGASFATKNDAYIEAAVTLGERVVLDVLGKADLDPGSIDHFISTSCTGFMIPSLDAVLAHRLRMSRRLSRLPITEHGCAAGAVALAQARTHLAAYPDHRVLVLCVELPSFTFQREDLSPENVIAAGLFADGAGAAVVANVAREGRPRIVAAESCLFPDSADLMGFRLLDSGLKLVLSREVPGAIREHAVPALGAFLERHHVAPRDVRHWLLHPGGRKIIESFEAALSLGPSGLAHSRNVLRERGNLSSATVIAMLDSFFASTAAAPGDLGVLVAFGPGFGAEMLLLQW